MVKRLLINIDERSHQRLSDEAWALGMTISNYVRTMLGLPLERRGVRSPRFHKSTTRRAKR